MAKNTGSTAPVVRNNRPAGMPYDPSCSETTPFMVPLTERQHALIEVVQRKLRTSPAVVALGASVTKSSAARSIIEAGIRALAAEHGIDIDAAVSAAQADYDEWAADEEHAIAAKAFRAAQV